MAPGIDSHVHLWQVARGDYGWLTPDLTALYRDFGPDDLDPMRRKHGIDGVILVQAAATVAETEYLLGLAADTPWVRGVVGWVEFADPTAPAEMARLAANPWLKGLRPMIQDIPDDDWMLRPDLDAAFRALIDLELCFDALTFPRHLENLLVLLGRYPELRTVICHGSKPQIRDRAFAPWADDMKALARETSALCKFSGLVTEAALDWTEADLRPYVDHLLEVFGPDRLIWGSDWPVCTLAAPYDAWRAAAESLTANLSDTEKAAIFGGNAEAFYRL